MAVYPDYRLAEAILKHVVGEIPILTVTMPVWNADTSGFDQIDKAYRLEPIEDA